MSQDLDNIPNNSDEVKRPSHNREDLPRVKKAESQKETLFDDIRQREMRHQETISRDAVVRSKSETLKTIFIFLIIALILGFVFWFMTHGAATQDDITARVDKLIAQGNFDAARDEARKLSTRGDTLTNIIQYNRRTRQLLKKIDREEKNWNLANHITIGKSSSSFIGMKYKEAQSYLVKLGFSKKNIRLSEIAYDDLTRKQKKNESGIVIGVTINDDKKFGEKDKFSPNSIIEIYYTGK